jgi:hypothetical protein
MDTAVETIALQQPFLYGKLARLHLRRGTSIIAGKRPGFKSGHALREAARDRAIDMDFAAAQMASVNFPHLAKVFDKGRIEIDRSRFKTVSVCCSKTMVHVDF